MKDALYYWARPGLRDRIAQMVGSQRGVANFAALRTYHFSERKQISNSLMREYLRADRPTPLWLVVALVQLVEGDRDMGIDVALRLAPDWFEAKRRDEVTT